MNNFYEFLKYATSRLEYLDSLDSYIEKVSAKGVPGVKTRFGGRATKTTVRKAQTQLEQQVDAFRPNSTGGAPTGTPAGGAPTKPNPAAPTQPPASTKVDTEAKVDPTKVDTEAKVDPTKPAEGAPAGDAPIPGTEGSGKTQGNAAKLVGGGLALSGTSYLVGHAMGNTPATGGRAAENANALSANAQALREAEDANAQYKAQLAHFENMNILERLLFLIFGSDYQSYLSKLLPKQ